MASRKNAYDLIKQMILDDEIPEGSVLVERELAERIGVSRVPVREALQRLAVEGIIVQEPGRGLVTRAYSFQDIAELYLYREALDGMAARLFAQRADEMTARARQLGPNPLRKTIRQQAGGKLAGQPDEHPPLPEAKLGKLIRHAERVT